MNCEHYVCMNQYLHMQASMCQRVPMQCQRVPMQCQRVPMQCQRVPMQCQRVPMQCQRVPMQCQRVPMQCQCVPMQCVSSSNQYIQVFVVATLLAVLWYLYHYLISIILLSMR